MLPISELKGFNCERILVKYEHGYMTTGLYKDGLILLDGNKGVNLWSSPDEFESFIRLNEIDKQPVKMSFKDAPDGARFRYPNMSEIWVKINSHPKSNISGCNGCGLIVKWNGNVQGFQSYCSFCDEENNITFDTIVELI